MVTQLITVRYCDVHAAKGEETVDALGYEVSLDSKPTAIDLCDECYAQYLSPLADLLAEHTKPRRRKAKASATKTPDYECPDCELAFTTPQGRGAHRNKVHGYRTGDDGA